MNSSFSQWYLLFFLLAFFLLVFVFRSYLFWKKTGLNPMTFTDTDDAHGFIGRLFKYLLLTELIVVLAYIFAKNWYIYLIPFWYLENSTLNLIGWLLLHAALVWIFIAQLQMKDSWRIGIDTVNPSPLVTRGLFHISRNPIFLGIIIADIGLFLVIPNAFTLLVSILSITMVHIQIRLEEDFLLQLHQQAYTDYCRKVRRWI